MYEFKKLLRLPSNGLSYNSIIELKPLTNSFLYFMEDPLFKNNFSENKAAGLKPYISMSPYEMYYADLLFIWNYYMITTFKKTEMERVEICRNCKTENMISIPLDKLDVVYLENKQEILSFDFVYNNKIMTINYRRRKTIDNIETAFDNFELQDALNNINNYIAYFSKLFFRQIVSIYYEKEITEINDRVLFDIFSYSDDKSDMINLFYQNLIENTDFGIVDNIGYICKNCEHKNKIKFFDIISDSFFIKNITDTKTDNLAFLDFIKAGFITLSEVMELPVSLNENFFSECVKVVERENNSVGKNDMDYRKFHGLA